MRSKNAEQLAGSATLRRLQPLPSSQNLACVEPAVQAKSSQPVYIAGIGITTYFRYGCVMAHSPFLTVAEVAAYTRLSKETVRKLAKSGELPHIKYGDQYRIVRSAVIRDEPHACTCGAVCPVSTSSAEEASAH